MATVSGGRASKQFGFIEKCGKELGVRYLCDWLGVSRSGYYAWLKRGESQRSKDDRSLLVVIKSAFEKSRGTYGSPRIHRTLKKQGVDVGCKRVARLMREAGLRARCYRLYRRLPGLHKYYTSITNLRLDTDPPSAINQHWVADLTYLKANNKRQYLATVMDLYSRRIIGWGMSCSKNTELTIRALKAAIKKRKPERGLIFHTDRGSEYRAYSVQKELKKHGIVPSMNRPFRSIDNAEMESFYKSLKGDLIRGSEFESKAMLESALKSYINHFYNRQRLHSSLGYMSPVEYELCQA